MKEAGIAFMGAILAILLWLIWKPLVIGVSVFYCILWVYRDHQKDKKPPSS